MSTFITIRGFAVTTAVMAVLVTGTAARANDTESNSDDGARVMPFGFGAFGGMNMMAMPIDTNADGIVSASEASQHASAGFSIFDSDGDSQLSQDEYMMSAVSTMAMGRCNVDRLFVNRIARFTNMDADSNESVTLPEFMASAQASYDAADTNGDGTVTVWEFRAKQNPF